LPSLIPCINNTFIYYEEGRLAVTSDRDVGVRISSQKAMKKYENYDLNVIARCRGENFVPKAYEKVRKI
jgi:hypothetical protein